MANSSISHRYATVPPIREPTANQSVPQDVPLVVDARVVAAQLFTLSESVVPSYLAIMQYTVAIVNVCAN